MSPEKALLKTFEFGPNKINYRIQRTSRRGSVGIYIISDVQILLRVPRRFSEKNLPHILKKRADWILEQQNHFKNHPRPQPLAPQKPIPPALLKKYRAQALQKIEESISRFQTLIGIYPKKISVRNQRQRWGSCNKYHHLSFNWRLVLLPPPLLDYVVVHEMCHMLHLNHSAKFWGKVKSILPDCFDRRRLLRDKSHEYFNIQKFV